MERINIIIFSRNKAYGERLFTYLQEKKDSQMKFFLATGDEGFEKLLEKEKIHGVLLDHELAKKYSKLPHPVHLVKEEPEGENEIFMYQQAGDIYAKLKTCFSVDEFGGGESRIYCVFSPEGAADKTEFALSFCKEQAEKGKVLYLSFSGFPVLFREELLIRPELSENGLSQMMFELSEKNFRERMEGCSFLYEGIRVMAPFWHYKDLLDVEQKEIQCFFELLKKEGDFQSIVVEMGQLFEYTFDIMELSDRVLIPMTDGVFDQIRLNVLRGYLRLEKREKLTQKFQIIIEEEGVEFYDEIGRRDTQTGYW